MKAFWKFCVIGLASVTVAGCAGLELERARQVQPTGSPYDVALAKGYLEMARQEYGEGDYRDSDRFAQRSMVAARGQAVAPQEIGQRRLPGDKVGELTAARAQLVGLQGRGAAAVAPSDTARAQLMFDCWMQEQEENRQPNDIAACRQGFEAAVRRVEFALAPAAAPAPVARMPGGFMVFFDLDKDVLTPEARNIVATAAAQALKTPGARVTAVGHTDTTGSAAHNMRLSIRRANNVKAALVADGMSAANITTEGRGQTDLLVPTADGVNEPQNRRVEINFSQ
ncbi:MAG: OmpA family protein [Rhodospirillales bacterium]